jgi:ABC-type antimicrobial peptide transport system permease subunit
MVLATIAWLVGVVLSITAAYGFMLLLGLVFIQIPFAFNPLMLLYMLGFIIVIATLTSFMPVISATRVRIADALRYE